MKIKIGAMEKVTQTSNRRFLKLLSPQPICNFYRFKYLSLENAGTFYEVFGEDTKFFYVLEQYTADAVTYYERGIGYVTTNHLDETYLVREHPICFRKNCDSLRPMGDTLPYLAESEDSILIASSTLPVSYLEALLSPHSVLASTDSSPNIVYMPNGSILGRLENDIEAISLDVLAEKVANILRDVPPKAAPSAPSPLEGSIRYNNYNNSYEVFINHDWRARGVII